MLMRCMARLELTAPFDPMLALTICVFKVRTNEGYLFVFLNSMLDKYLTVRIIFFDLYNKLLCGIKLSFVCFY